MVFKSKKSEFLDMDDEMARPNGLAATLTFILPSIYK